MTESLSGHEDRSIPADLEPKEKGENEKRRLRGDLNAYKYLRSGHQEDGVRLFPVVLETGQELMSTNLNIESSI